MLGLRDVYWVPIAIWIQRVGRCGGLEGGRECNRGSHRVRALIAYG